MKNVAAAPEKLVGALVSGLSVLRCLSASTTPLGVSRIARELGLNSSTCFNILKTLVHEKLVYFNDATKTYEIGLGLIELAKGALEQKAYIRAIHPHLEEIALRHRVTATLWHLAAEQRVVLVDRADSDSAVRVHMSIGQRLPMYLAALGRVMAAYSSLSAMELRTYFSEMRWEKPLDFETYLAEIQEARKLGYAVDDGYFSKGITTVSAAVLNAEDRPLMAISAVGIGAQFSKASIKALGEDLHDRAVEISRVMAGGTR